MPLDARNLRHVVTLAAHGNYRRAAAALHVSQPALSRSVASLETLLGVKLFDRNRRGVVPTPFGRLLVDRGSALLTGFDDIRHEIGLLNNLESGELSIGAGLYPAELSVGTAIGRLSARYPGLRITLRAEPWRQVADAVSRGALDLAVVESSALETDKNLMLEPLPQHQGAFVCRPGHPLLGMPNLTLDKVFRYPFVGPRLPARIGMPLHGLAHGFRPDPTGQDLIPSLHVESSALAKKVVIAGDAVAILPHALVVAELAAGKLAVLPWRPAWLHTRYGFVYRRDRTLSPSARAFIAEVKAIEATLEDRPTPARARDKPRRRPRAPQ